MKICNEVWRTIYESDFCDDKYLYHFTDIEKSIKILYSNSLKFSKIGATNDTLESKPKIIPLGQGANEFYDAIEHFRNINKEYLQLLCFTRDSEKSNETTTGKRMYTDYSGRGFALPRMWAQYSKNNTGVCLVFDKNELIKLIKKELGLSLIHHDVIKYIGKFEDYKINSSDLNKLLDQINQYKSTMQKSFADINFFSNNIEFVKYNYFSKLDDWIGENEYRFLAYGEEDYFIKNMKETLIGIVIGEKIEPANENIIKILCKDFCEIKKITFTYKGCQIINVY